MQWIQDPSRSNVDILNNVRRNASIHFMNEKKAYLKAKIEELETNSKVNNVRGINDFKKGYQPRTIIVKDKKGELVANPHSIMARWRNYFSQQLNVHEDNDVRQAEIHSRTTSAWSKCLWGWVGYWNAKKITNHQVLIRSQQNWLKQGVGQFAVRFINLLFLFGIRMNCLKNGRSQS